MTTLRNFQLWGEDRFSEENLKRLKAAGYEPHSIFFSEAYDALYYQPTGEWYEKACSSPDCHYCRNRPEKAVFEPDDHPWMG